MKSAVGAAQPDRTFRHRLEHRPQIERRAADDIEDLRRRRLLLQRFGEIGSPLAQFVEQPHVLNGDSGLISEGRHQLDLLFAE
jgi:hypothetical protein